jgi:putative membrane protein
VRSGRYYFAVTIPASFSEDVTSVGGDHPTAAQIDVTYDDANSFLASTLGTTAMAQVRDAVASTVGQRQVDQVLVGLGSARDGFAQASDGAITLTAASGQLSTGAHQVADGAGAAATGAATLARGAARTASGATTLSSGAGTLDTGTAALATGAAQAASGATTLAGGAAQVAAGAHEASTSVTGLANGLSTMSTDLTSLAGYLTERATVDGDARAGALLTRLAADAGALPDATTTRTIVAGLGAIDTGAAQVSAGTSTLASKLGTLSSGATALAAGADRLSSGAKSLAAGTTQVAAGAATLSTGVQSLTAGANRLAAGSDQLTSGSQTLGSALSTGATQIPDDSVATRTERATTISDPVVLSSTHITAAQGFGEGFAPFFLSLALFVGSLITWLLLRPIPSRALAGPASDWRVTLNGYLPALSLGVLQVAVMLGVIHFGLGLTMATAWGTIALTLL